ncbi:MAG: hypothetical protein IPO99_18460 [Nitrospira sp.]|nr:hypothetical protein [Nitrospira sp.]
MLGFEELFVDFEGGPRWWSAYLFDEIRFLLTLPPLALSTSGPMAR